MQHISTKEVSEYLVQRAKKIPGYGEMGELERAALRLQIAEVLIWDLVMDLELDMRVKRIKLMRSGK